MSNMKNINFSDMQNELVVRIQRAAANEEKCKFYQLFLLIFGFFNEAILCFWFRTQDETVDLCQAVKVELTLSSSLASSTARLLHEFYVCFRAVSLLQPHDTPVTKVVLKKTLPLPPTRYSQQHTQLANYIKITTKNLHCYYKVL